MELQFTSRIDKGKVREFQQDCLIDFDLLTTPRKSKVFVLADGMGGLANGDVASQSATQNVKKIFSENAQKEKVRKLIVRSVREANRKVFKVNQKRGEEREMGSTLTCVEFFESHFDYAHVGDSRLYRLRHKKMMQLTTDHALDRCTLTQAIGLQKKLNVDSRSLALKKRDLFLLCSDGLYGMVEHAKLEALLSDDQSLETIADGLLAAALHAGGEDNISFYLIRVERETEKADAKS